MFSGIIKQRYYTRVEKVKLELIVFNVLTNNNTILNFKRTLMISKCCLCNAEFDDRYSDFVVNEINTDMTVVHLTNTEAIAECHDHKPADVDGSCHLSDTDRQKLEELAKEGRTTESVEIKVYIAANLSFYAPNIHLSSCSII